MTTSTYTPQVGEWVEDSNGIVGRVAEVEPYGMPGTVALSPWISDPELDPGPLDNRFICEAIDLRPWRPKVGDEVVVTEPQYGIGRGPCRVQSVGACALIDVRDGLDGLCMVSVADLAPAWYAQYMEDAGSCEPNLTDVQPLASQLASSVTEVSLTPDGAGMSAVIETAPASAPGLEPREEPARGESAEVGLLSCPFCGGTPEVVRSRGMERVRCRCGVHGPGLHGSSWSDRGKGVAAWNRRPAPKSVTILALRERAEKAPLGSFAIRVSRVWRWLRRLIRRAAVCPDCEGSGDTPDGSARCHCQVERASAGGAS